MTEFIEIPYEIMETGHLTKPSELSTYIALCAMVDPNVGYASAKIEDIADLARCSMSTAQRALVVLTRYGYVEVVGRDPDSGCNRYRLPPIDFDYPLMDVPDDKASKKRSRTYRSKRMMEHFNDSCALTGLPNDIQVDHALPRGVDWELKDRAQNKLPLNYRVNASKNDRHMFEWYEQHGERFGISKERFEGAVKYLADLNEMTPEEYRAFYDVKYEEYRRRKCGVEG